MTQATFTCSGGTLPNGSSSATVETDKDSVTVPDSFIVDYPGYCVVKWGSTYPGGQVSSGTHSRSRVTDSRTYASGSKISVRIWRTWNEYRDVTEMLDADGGLPVMRLAENRPGSCGFTLDMDWETASRNPLSASFGGWSR